MGKEIRFRGGSRIWFCAGYDLEYLSTRGPDEFLRWLTPPGEGDGPMMRYNVYVYDRH